MSSKYRSNEGQTSGIIILPAFRRFRLYNLYSMSVAMSKKSISELSLQDKETNVYIESPLQKVKNKKINNILIQQVLHRKYILDLLDIVLFLQIKNFKSVFNLPVRITRDYLSPINHRKIRLLVRPTPFTVGSGSKNINQSAHAYADIIIEIKQILLKI